MTPYTTPSILLYGLAAAATLARASLSNMRATIPGSIHQCSTSNVFFFDTNDAGSSKVLLFVSPDDAALLGPGQLSLSSVLSSITPLQKIENIDSKDAEEFDFTVELKEDTEFSTIGFLSDGSGKNLGLDRKVMQPLPGAPDCLAASEASEASGAGTASAASQVVQASAASAASTASESTTSVPPGPTTTTPAKSSSSASSSSSSSSSTSQQEYASRFVTSTRPKATAASSSSSAPSVATSLAALSASLSLPPSSATNATATAADTGTKGTVPAAAAATSPVVVKAKYLLTSFIEISDDKSTDGTVSSSVIKGGYITGSGSGSGGVNGTILPIGTVLYAPNSTASTSVVAANANSTSTSAKNNTQASSMLLSASYTFTMKGQEEEEEETVFVMATTPLAQNFTTEALLMTFQSSNPNSTVFSNITILGKAQTINTTMFRIDSYYLEDDDSEEGA